MGEDSEGIDSGSGNGTMGKADSEDVGAAKLGDWAMGCITDQAW
jgi:hypothetical protein